MKVGVDASIGTFATWPLAEIEHADKPEPRIVGGGGKQEPPVPDGAGVSGRSARRSSVPVDGQFLRFAHWPVHALQPEPLELVELDDQIRRSRDRP